MGRTILLRLMESYFRHRWLYMLPVAIMTIFAGIYIYNQERLYISSGVFFTEQKSLLASLTAVETDGFSWNTPAQDTTSEISDLIRTDAFIRAVIQKTGLEAEMSKGDAVVKDTISEVRKRIWVSIAGISQVQVNAANPNPYTAQQLAQATIDTFIQWKINLDRTDSVTASTFFDELIEGYRIDVLDAQQALKGYLETHPEPVRGTRPDTEELEIQLLQTDADLAGTRVAQALGKAEEARLAETQVESNIRQKYTVVDAPNLPDKPAISKRKMAMNAGVFLVVGVLISGIAIVGATILERSFRTTLDVEHELSLPILALMPDVTEQVPKKRFPWLKKGKPVPENVDEAIIGNEPVENREGEEEPDQQSILLDIQELDVDFQQDQQVEKL